MKIITKIFLSAFTILLCHNSFAGKGIITRPEPFYISEVPFFDESGKKRYFDELEGQTVLLVFWATWCGACADEMNSLDTLAKDFRKLPFKIIALSQDYQNISVVKDFYKSHEIRHLEIFHDYRNAFFQDMSVVGLPTAFLIDQNSKVKIEFKGAIKWHEEEIRKMLLDEIPNNPETPKNTYKEISLNKNIIKSIDQSSSIDDNNKVENNNAQIKDETKAQ